LKSGTLLLLAVGCADFDTLDRCTKGGCGETAGSCIAELSAGWSHTCARKVDGTVWCWGNNNGGQLGAATPPLRLIPAAVAQVDQAIELSAGDSHTCAVVSGGAVLCWGFNDQGQVGDGRQGEVVASPVPVVGLAGATQVAAGTSHTCARKDDGSVLCWGSNTHGELGDGTMAGQTMPVAVVGLSRCVEVAVGWTHSCALKDDGTVWCWGANSYGQRGDMAAADLGAPMAAVAGFSDGAHLSAGFYETCVIRRNGTVYCWGLNSHGELGDGTTMDRSSPAKTLTMTNTWQLSNKGYQTKGP
jgi:alpha-tubulin suppressor-like RCC1 family protein